MRQGSQRALVLQCGGSLGAYEAGVYEVHYMKRLLKWIKRKEKQLDQLNHPYLNLCYFVGVFTAGRDGKDGRGHTVQSFPQHRVWRAAMISTKHDFDNKNIKI